jgi:hypothetical protein
VLVLAGLVYDELVKHKEVPKVRERREEVCKGGGGLRIYALNRHANISLLKPLLPLHECSVEPQVAHLIVLGVLIVVEEDDLEGK